jgi:coenzyme F420-reducing hydrogenase beta subunit
MKTKKKTPILASVRECTGCSACADSCGHNAISMVVRDDGHKYPQLDSTKCILCKACEKACPVRSNMQYGTNRGNSTPLAAWTFDKNLINLSASGGIFAAIATHILEIGGYVVGAVSEGNSVRHIIIDNIIDLHRLQGTKYLQSDTTGVYRQIKSLLLRGKTVLFSGTGCQVGGLLQYLKKPYLNLYTIDLVCAGVPSSLIMTRFCKEEHIEPEYIRWRDKEHGWQHGLQITILEKGEQKKFGPQNCFFGGGFLGGATNRWSCYKCRFTGANRISDFTVGDYWGCTKWREQWHDGVSVLIVHSFHGESFLKECDIITQPTNWRDCTYSNPRVLLGNSPLMGVAFERRLLPWAFKHLNYSTLKKIYAGNLTNKDILWLPYKLFKFMRWKLTQIVTKDQLQKALTQIVNQRINEG